MALAHDCPSLGLSTPHTHSSPQTYREGLGDSLVEGLVRELWGKS